MHTAREGTHAEKETGRSSALEVLTWLLGSLLQTRLEGVVLWPSFGRGDYNFFIFKIPTFQKRTPDVFVPRVKFLIPEASVDFVAEVQVTQLSSVRFIWPS
jgi:hypothetical protein